MSLTETITDSGSNFVKAFKVFGKKSGTELNRGTETDELAEKEKASDTAQSMDIQTKTTAELLDAAGDSSDSDDEYEADESESEESEDSDLSEIDSSPEHSSQEDESDEEDESINLNPSTVTDRSNVAGDNGGVTFVNLTKQLTRTDDSRGIYSLPMHRRCAAHQLNLVSKTDLRKIKDTVYVSLYKSTFDKCKKAWNLESRSTKTSDYIQSKMGILFIIPNSTRWSSFYRAAERVRRMLRQSPTKFNSVLKHCEVTPFTSSEEQFLKEYVKIMSYVADALDVLQGEENVSAGYLLPTIHILQLKMATLKSDTTIVHSQQLIQVVLSSIKNRFGKCFEVRDYRIAAFVHPMFKLNWLSNEDREKAIDQLKVEIEMEENRSGSPAGIESKMMVC